VIKPAKEMAGLYAIIEGSIGKREALLLPSLGKSREAFTTSLVAANAFYLSLASDAADQARRSIATRTAARASVFDTAHANATDRRRNERAPPTLSGRLDRVSSLVL
jgi:hypothetical protein